MTYRHAGSQPEQHADDDDLGQAGTLTREVMSATDRQQLAGNLVAHAGRDRR